MENKRGNLRKRTRKHVSPDHLAVVERFPITEHFNAHKFKFSFKSASEAELGQCAGLEGVQMTVTRPEAGQVGPQTALKLRKGSLLLRDSVSLLVKQKLNQPVSLGLMVSMSPFNPALR